MRLVALLLVALVVAGPAAAQLRGWTDASSAKPTAEGPVSAHDGPLSIHMGIYTAGRAVGFIGTPITILVSLSNSLDEPAQGNLTFSPLGDARIDTTTVTYGLAPGAAQAWEVNLTIHGASGGIAAEAPRFEARAELTLQGEPALSVQVTSPPSTTAMGAAERLRFLANVTNVGPTPLSETLHVTFLDRPAASVALDPPLAPNETRVVDWGLLPAPTPPLMASGQTSVVVLWSITRAAGSEMRPTFALEHEAGRVRAARVVEDRLLVSHGPRIDLEVGDVGLGQASTILAHIRHDGTEPIVVTLRIFAHSPVLRLDPAWAIPEHAEVFELRPGVSRTVKFEFTPRVSGTLHIEASLFGGSFYVGDSERVVLPSPFWAEPADDEWLTHSDVGTTATWRVRFGAHATVEDARVRVAVAPRHGSTFDGLIRSSDLVGVTVHDGDLGRLPAGENRTVTLELDGKASGSYLVVPYIELDGIAYLGAVEMEQPQNDGRPMPRGSMDQRAYEAVSLGSVVLMANVMPIAIPEALALLPAGLLIAATVALWVGRRMLVR